MRNWPKGPVPKGRYTFYVLYVFFVHPVDSRALPAYNYSAQTRENTMHDHFTCLPHNHCRWMIRRDMEEVLQIESTQDDAWCEEDILRCLRQRNIIGMVVERGEKVVGFYIYELHKAHIELLRFCVHPMFRREGVFSAMVQKITSKLSSHRRRRAICFVPDTLLPCHLALKKNNFIGYAITSDTYEFTYYLPDEEYDIGGEG